MKIGFIGLGNVGAKLAGSLLRNEFGLVVRDTDREAARLLLDRGAQWGESGRQIAQLCDVVITCLPSPTRRSEFHRGIRSCTKPRVN